MIPENLPDYVDRGGRQVWRPPYMARETEVFGFVVECRREAIDRLLRRDLVEPSGGALDYRCARDRVAILFARIGRLASADHRDTLRGYVSELEVSVWCLAADVLAGGRLVWYLPYVFVDSGQAAASGREVYGYPKQMATFEPRYPERLASPGTTTTVKAQAIDRYDPDAKAVPRPMISATRSPGAGQRRPDGVAGLIGHVAADLAVDRSLPYGERLYADHTLHLLWRRRAQRWPQPTSDWHRRASLPATMSGTTPPHPGGGRGSTTGVVLQGSGRAFRPLCRVGTPRLSERGQAG